MTLKRRRAASVMPSGWANITSPPGGHERSRSALGKRVDDDGALRRQRLWLRGDGRQPSQECVRAIGMRTHGRDERLIRERTRGCPRPAHARWMRALGFSACGNSSSVRQPAHSVAPVPAGTGTAPVDARRTGTSAADLIAVLVVGVGVHHASRRHLPARQRRERNSGHDRARSTAGAANSAAVPGSLPDQRIAKARCRS
jgi:hypothetical protein